MAILFGHCRHPGFKIHEVQWVFQLPKKLTNRFMINKSHFLLRFLFW